LQEVERQQQERAEQITLLSEQIRSLHLLPRTRPVPELDEDLLQYVQSRIAAMLEREVFPALKTFQSESARQIERRRVVVRDELFRKFRPVFEAKGTFDAICLQSSALQQV